MMTDIFREDYDRQSARDRQREILQEARERRVAVIKTLAGTRDGIEFLLWALDDCGVFRQEVFTDQVSAAWRAGMRAHGLALFELIMDAGAASILFAAAQDAAAAMKENTI